MSTAFMTSPIGDLTIDSVGLRKAIDEIAAQKKIIAEQQEQIRKLKLKLNKINGTTEGSSKTYIVEAAVLDAHYGRTIGYKFIGSTNDEEEAKAMAASVKRDATTGTARIRTDTK